MLKYLEFLFLPHEKNNHKPKVLHLSSLLILFLIIGFFQATLTLLTRLYPGVLGFAANIQPERIVVLTNEQRNNQGLGSLTINSLLSEAARQKAAEMFTFGCWSHNCNGRNPWWFFKNVSYNYLYAGENLAKDFGDAETAVSAWMDSPTHRDNILNNNYKEIGIAVVDGTLNGEETTLIVQLFGTPAKAQVATLPVAEKTAVQGVEIKEGVSPVVPPEAQTPQMLMIQNQIINKLPKISSFDLTKWFYLMLVLLMIVVFIIDALIISHKQIIRISGKSFVHISFFIIILISILLSKAGRII